MMLNKALGEKINADAELKDEMGRCLPAVTVFALAIEFLVKDVHTNMSKVIAGGIKALEIKWVITVPAIWTDPAKKFMRIAAEKAGISSDKLLIALEPECASFFCRYLPIEKRLDKTGVDVSSFPVGTKYMILDAGGGTVDITVHEVSQTGALKEITAAGGGGWGGIFVDQAFEDVIIDLVGKNVYQKFKVDSTEDWLDFWRDFELKKRHFSGRPVTIKLPLTLITLFQDVHKQKLSEKIQVSKYSSHIKLTSDKMRMQSAVWLQLYDTSITNTLSYVKSLLAKQEVEGVKHIIMVGGFSESTVLQERITDTFRSDGYNVIIPIEASTAVLRGALIYGHNPRCIVERVLQYTYGFDSCRNFIEGKHPESKKVVRDSGVKCDKCFSKHVEIGQIVKAGESQTSMSYTPTMKNLKNLLFSLYFSKHKDPEYTDEEGCWFMESFEVPLTDSAGDLDRRVYVSLTFSGTEIEAEGREEKTGYITKAKFKLPD